MVDQLLADRIAQAGDVLTQRFLAIEASLTEGGRRTVARHREVLRDAKVNTLTEKSPGRADAPTGVESCSAEEAGVDESTLGNRRSRSHGSPRRRRKRAGRAAARGQERHRQNWEGS